jgi:hypothetical protein
MNSEDRLQLARHDVGPLEPWRASLANNAQLIAVILARGPLPRDGADLLEAYRDRAALASLFPDEGSERDTAVSLGAASAHAAALAQSRPDGLIELAVSGSGEHRFPAGASALTPGLWVNGWSLALVARDRAALAALCDARTIAACLPPADRVDSFWPSLFAALSALALAAPEFPALAIEARRALATGASRVVEPGYVEHLLLPLMDLGERLAAGDAAGWDEALAGALAQHADWFADESRRFDRSGFLAFGLLGIAALAHEQGIATRVESAYLPLALVAGQFARQASSVTYIYPTRKLSRPDEARWFLDLEGFPRSQCHHYVAEVGGRLVACYTAQDAPGIPKARADFALAPARDDDEPRPDDSLDYALDLGELVLIADWFARRAGELSLPEPERRASLSEAIDALDAAIARFPPDAESAPETSFRTERGQSAFAREPSRFSRARLQAYADTLRARAREGDEPNEPAGESAAQAGAMAAIELIRAQVAPLLEAIARDRSGEVVKLLRPRADDYAKVFVAEAIDAARRAYEPVWDGSLKIAYPSPQQTVLRCHVAPAGLLAEDNELSRHFPGGYRAIARWLNPHRAWVAWKYLRPGEEAGISYDGLVWIDDHWAWFPKPYRHLKLPLA